ncbi:MAG: S1/P1 nuclease [Planctomycetes bacterium]|nr:S1/P1 nuclease [Planctomycetota bacterium]
MTAITKWGRVLAVVLIVLTPLQAQAWHNRGHHAIARIAWLRLIELGLDRQATDLLNSHPHRDLYLAAMPPEGVERDEWMFVQSATWADWVRKPMAPTLDEQQARALSDEFNKPVWHYVNLPYVHPTETDKFAADKIRQTTLEPELDEQGRPRHVIAALKYNLQVLKNVNAPSADRAVALSWLMHLTGDLHQPLHAVGLIATKDAVEHEDLNPPSGDQGGNRLAVRSIASQPGAVSLHFYWDALVLGDQPYAAVQGRVGAWLNDPKFQRREFTEALGKTEFRDWAEESWKLAQSVVYADGDQFLKFQTLPDRYSRTSLETLQAPVLSADYQRRADEAAQKRMVLAGYRLGDLIAKSFQETSK